MDPDLARRRPQVVRNARKIADHPQGVRQGSPREWFTLQTKGAVHEDARRIRVYRSGDLLRCESDGATSEEPCAHILAVLMWTGEVEKPDTSLDVPRKGDDPRQWALEEKAWRLVPVEVPRLVGRLLDEALPLLTDAKPARLPRGRPRAETHALVYQAIMRVWERQSLRRLPGALSLPHHLENNPWGPVGRSTLSRFLASAKTTELLEKLLAVSVWPAAPYEDLIHPDGTGLTESRFSAYFDERPRKDKNGNPKKAGKDGKPKGQKAKDGEAKEGPRRHKWAYTEIVWSYRYTLVASMYSQAGPFGEASWFLPLAYRARIMLDGLRFAGGDTAYSNYYVWEGLKRLGMTGEIIFRANANPTRSHRRKRDYKRGWERSQLDPDGYAARANRKQNVETGNHALKALLGDAIYSTGKSDAGGRDFTAKRNEALCMALAYNMTRLVLLSVVEGDEIHFTGGARRLASRPWRSLEWLQDTMTEIRGGERRIRDTWPLELMGYARPMRDDDAAVPA